MATKQHSRPHERYASSAAVEDPPEPSETEDAPAVTPLVAPTSVLDLADPRAVQGTRHQGPVLCGSPDDGLPGTVFLHKRFRFNFSHGSFSIPVQLPAGAFPLKFFTVTETLYDSATSAAVEFDQASGGTIMSGASVNLKAGVITETIFTLLPNPATNTIWLKVALVGATTAGVASVLLWYSVPAKSVQS